MAQRLFTLIASQSQHDSSNVEDHSQVPTDPRQWCEVPLLNHDLRDAPTFLRYNKFNSQR